MKGFQKFCTLSLLILFGIALQAQADCVDVIRSKSNKNLIQLPGAAVYWEGNEVGLQVKNALGEEGVIRSQLQNTNELAALSAVSQISRSDSQPVLDVALIGQNSLIVVYYGSANQQGFTMLIDQNSHKCVELSGDEASLIANYALSTGATISSRQVRIPSAAAVANELFS